MSFKTDGILSNSHDIKAHQEDTPGVCCWQTARLKLKLYRDLLWVYSVWLLYLLGMSWEHTVLLICSSRIVIGSHRCSHVHVQYSTLLLGIPNLITVTAMLLRQQSSETPRQQDVFLCLGESDSGGEGWEQNPGGGKFRGWLDWWSGPKMQMGTNGGACNMHGVLTI